MFALLAVALGRAALVQLAIDVAAVVGAVKLILDTVVEVDRIRKNREEQNEDVRGRTDGEQQP